MESGVETMAPSTKAAGQERSETKEGDSLGGNPASFIAAASLALSGRSQSTIFAEGLRLHDPVFRFEKKCCIT